MKPPQRKTGGAVTDFKKNSVAFELEKDAKLKREKKKAKLFQVIRYAKTKEEAMPAIKEIEKMNAEDGIKPKPDWPETGPAETFVVQIKSAGYNAGNFSKISVNGEEVDIDKFENSGSRGLHIVILDMMDDSLVLSEVFDTYKSSKLLEK